MSVVRIGAPYATPLSSFLSDPQAVVQSSGADAVAVLHDNYPLFYVLSPQGWAALQQQAPGAVAPSSPVAGQVPVDVPASAPSGLDRFERLAEQLYVMEMQRMERGDLSRAAVGILRNRLQAHVMPFFRDVPPSRVDTGVLEGFVERLTAAGLSTTTMSQYLVVVRKLLRLAVRHKLLREVPEMPQVRVVHRPRAMLTLAEYAAVVQAAQRLVRQQRTAPQVKLQGRSRERFWVAPKHLTLPRDMGWVIRFMVNSFIRPGDLRQLKHKHVQVCRGEHLYLRLTLPETKRHDAPMVTLRPAVQVYEAALAQARAQGHGGPDDYVFLPAERDRTYALAVLGFWFKWAMREAGLETEDTWGRPRTLYCLRHTAIMFRLLYGQGIDMLTLARNARTSVQMIERFYASALSGEMNVTMLQSRRKSG
jgi:integrase